VNAEDERVPTEEELYAAYLLVFMHYPTGMRGLDKTTKIWQAMKRDMPEGGG
jgi:hypothetical protein